MKGKAAFTLLEVMVAVALLALALTSVFSGEVAAIKVDQRGRRLMLATHLVRCKMGEVEEKIAKEGMPAILAEDEDDCCADGKMAGYRCKWKIERIVLPDITDNDSLGLQRKSKGDDDKKTERSDKSILDNDSALLGFSLPSMSSGLKKGIGADAIAQMAMQYAFPVLKPVIEEQVRRVTVTIEWTEGVKKRSFDVSQFVVAERPPTALTMPPSPSSTPTAAIPDAVTPNAEPPPMESP